MIDKTVLEELGVSSIKVEIDSKGTVKPTVKLVFSDPEQALQTAELTVLITQYITSRYEALKGKSESEIISLISSALANLQECAKI